jgi:cytochrome c oxidase assembly protein Cox11
MVSDVILHGASTLRFSWTVTKMMEGKSIEVEYNGDFKATGEWVFEPVDGKTKVKYIWIGQPRILLLSLAFYVLDMKKLHSEAIQQGFKGLNDYIIKK